MNRYTQEQIDFLKKHYQYLSIRQLKNAFNEYFGLNKGYSAIQTIITRKNIRRNERNIQPLRKFTDKQYKWIKEKYKSLSLPELTQAFNDYFNENKSQAQIRAFINNRKITSGGRTGYFQKQGTPWNKGKKGLMISNAKTRFKPGQEPPNANPLYTERVDKDGFIKISVPETNPHTGCLKRTKHKHIWIWEQYYGPVPKGHCIMFKDGDNRNFDIENLICISRNELLKLNHHNYKHQPNEIKPAILALAKLEAEAGFRTA